jgi:hypothetical protein
MNNAIVKERLEHIAEVHGGVLRPRDVVEDARDPSSPLHAHFKWDVAEAAYEHWLDTARTLIASVKVNIITQTIALRAPAYVRDPTLPGREQGYRPTASVRNDRDLALEVLSAEVHNILSALRRAKNVATALNMDTELNDLMDQFMDMQIRLKNAA